MEKSFSEHPAYQQEELEIKSQEELARAKEKAGVTKHKEAMGRAQEYAQATGDVKLEIAAEKNLEEIEKIVSDVILTQENLSEGNFEFSPMQGHQLESGKIEYEFEVEKEYRFIISPDSILAKYPELSDEKKWQNHVIDTYDASGRCRIREKNGKPRLSLKVPLFSKDTERAKACLRMEFKPEDEAAENSLLKIRDLILAEKGTKQNEKFGQALVEPNGKKIWINKGLNEITGLWEYWVEVDEAEDIEPFPEIKVIRSEKSKIKVE